MKIYLASRYTRRTELAGYRVQLELMGYQVTSRWLDGNHQANDSDLLGEQAPDADRTRFALEDWQDLMAADVCINFTETPRGTNSRGGRHVEFGGALAAGKDCYVVGPRENVFHCLPNVKVVQDFEELLTILPQAADLGAKAAQLIDAERARQIEEKNWTPEHDDEHVHEELFKAAFCYLEAGRKLEEGWNPDDVRSLVLNKLAIWPWASYWFRVGRDPLRCFVKAGALYKAEIERQQRLHGDRADLVKLRAAVQVCVQDIRRCLEKSGAQ